MLSFWEKNSFTDYDLIVIGGGIVGLSAAITAAERNPQHKILLLERGLLPSGASTKNAGFACFGSLSELWADLQKMTEKEVKDLLNKRRLGLQKLRERLGDDNIGAAFYGGYELLFAENVHLLEQLPYINSLFAETFGGNLFEQQDEKIAQFGFNQRKVKHLLFNPYEFQIDTGKMMFNLWQKAQRLGVNLLTGAEVANLAQDPSHVKLKVSKHLAKDFTFCAEKVAICTNAFAAQLLPEIRLQPGRGQVICTKPLPNLAFQGVFHFDEGFYYFRNYGKRVIFGGGRNQALAEESTTELATTEFLLKHLEEKLSEIILPQQNFEIEHSWAGIMAFSENDKLPILEKVSERVAVAARLNGMGIAIGSLLGEEVIDLLQMD